MYFRYTFRIIRKFKNVVIRKSLVVIFLIINY